ncbi:MAG: hypothetical protein RLZZ312_1097 [Bacteroidota bacterium]
MTVQEVDDEGNIWFFSGKDRDRNKDIVTNGNVKLYFSSPDKDTYLFVNAEAKVFHYKLMKKKLWNPILKIWFKRWY